MTPRTHEQEVRCAKRRARAMNSLSLNVAGGLIPAEGYKSKSEIARQVSLQKAHCHERGRTLRHPNMRAAVEKWFAAPWTR